MDRTKRIIVSFLIFIGLITLGCLGYMIIEGWSFMDALYMTIITLATVGYSEVHQVSMPGRLFTVMLILLGVGFFLYVVGDIIQFLVEGRIRLVLGRHKLDTQIRKLNNHYIVCGYGRIGRVLTQYLTQKYIDVVVIERDENRIVKMNNDGILYLVGEAADEHILENAGIGRARGLITAVGTDAENVFLILIAKQKNPDIFVVARASQNSAKMALKAAGADKVISPYDIGARRMAHAILRPTVIKFLELAFADDSTDILIEEVKVSKHSSVIGVTMQNSGIRQNMDLIIMAIKKKNNKMVFNPNATTVIEADDILVVVGSGRNLKKLEKYLST